MYDMNTRELMKHHWAELDKIAQILGTLKKKRNKVLTSISIPSKPNSQKYDTKFSHFFNAFPA